MPADEVFRTDCGICILRAEPGIGKSTLLRAYISNSVDHWLSGRVQRTIPLMVNAVALAGTDPLPAALARASTSELKQFGLLDEVTPDFFRHQPRAGVPWLVLVDGLDEVPDTDARSAILRLLADTAETSPTLYRFVVATRPLPTGELDDLGPQVPHFQLQPFSPHDLHDYAMRWFRDLDDPPHHARTFTAELQRSGLSGLARTPLMASMLCQLYAANPARSLPGGRTGVYQSFVELIYEQNTHKHIASAHDKAIQTLKNRHQIPKDSLAAEQAAQLVRAHLPELIDYLAYQRITVGALPAIQVLASHLHVNRPEKVKEDHWNHFIGDLLRPTGLLTQRADDFDFLHQTLLEYHAARYATRDEQARLQVLCDLFPPWPPATSGRREPPTTESSYLGFLLDGLLIPEDHIATLTAQHVEALTAHGRRSACEFLVIQVRLHTSFPAGPTAAQLNRFADDATLDDTTRVSAADALVGVDREAGITQLIRFADDAILDDTDRVQAAWALAEVERQTGITRLTRFADDNTLDGTDRVQAAWALAEVDRQTGITRLTHLADDNTLDDTDRVWAADALVEVDREAGITQLTCLADDAILDDTARVRAAWAMTKLDRLREDAVARLTLLVNDTTLNDTARVQAAWALAEVDQEACITRLTRFADDAGLDHTARVRAAWALATKVDRHAGIIRLARFADDNTLDDTDRVWAADALAEVDREAGATRLTHLADDNTLDDTDRVWAADALAEVDREAGATRLT
ncbi:hypothetical protein, partial [Kitasatospora sp. NPDC047058]|uniref:NACHT domain-containing protein n=1 Tax=Kitasatospora sp. NPDC047058 TaxID=3155620 RepID=UPI0033ECFDE0